jgi:hypothetical protein
VLRGEIKALATKMYLKKIAEMGKNAEDERQTKNVIFEMVLGRFLCK